MAERSEPKILDTPITEKVSRIHVCRLLVLLSAHYNFGKIHSIVCKLRGREVYRISAGKFVFKSNRRD